MSEDWYQWGRQNIIDGITNIIVDSNNTEYPESEAAEAIYGYLEAMGLIDYDVEKDIFYDLWFEENGDDED